MQKGTLTRTIVKRGFWLKKKNEFDANLVYGSKKFHIDTGRDKIILMPTSELLKVVTRDRFGHYKRKNKYFTEQKECPICKGRNNVFLLERMGISVYHCKDCDFGFQNPRIKEDTLKRLYKNEKTSWPYYVLKPQILIDKKRYDYGLDLLGEFSLPSNGVLLDIGCGSGLSLKRAILKGWKRCIGIELSRGYEFPLHPRIEIINDSFEKAFKRLSLKADAVMVWDVLEHVCDPLSFLNSILGVMKQNSLLLIMVPNLKSLASRLMREKSPTFNWPHLSYFSPLSLRKALEKSFFKVEYIETVISEIGNINNYLAFADPYLGKNEKTVTLDFLTPKYIHEHLLGSRLLAIARKQG